MSFINHYETCCEFTIAHSRLPVPLMTTALLYYVENQGLFLQFPHGALGYVLSVPFPPLSAKIVFDWSNS